ncbi:MAG TPA: hypothetical protein VFQ61_38700, partial [Polyangiaceae bacterium]|nr:hypothetical protein [Polyangiaceae bacterium]
MRNGSGALLLSCVLLASSCRRGTDRNTEPRIEFGVLFGGDIQDRPVIPLELDASRQELALRVTFPEPVQRERRVRFELERPPAPNREKG